ncbi:lysophospholipid acyltransferase family protein [Algiphilus sp.]|uniref:lysophospholipid acyltransferase family protein n=1 Tax=Algiphilus sp. TaxID=1872431 RepID=UPI0025BF7EC5|nr:lysophospholipid acyltransferase family protein [Algiphilus sp.]MCK5771280.1 acyltransferase family protein [Algiphilus sp.]
MRSALLGRIAERLVTPEVESALARSAKPTGSFGYDPWGYNEQAVKLAYPLVQALYERYFRVRTTGLEHVPAHGRVLIIANHSGQLPMDGVLLGYALQSNPVAPRAPRAMIERFFPSVPWLGNMLTHLGGVIGDPANCARMLEREEAIIVFPEGIRGSGKPYRKRYQLQRFGNGFIRLALAHDTPVLPVGIVGCEETMPSVANIKPLARLLSVPYVPLAPPVPLPARVFINIGEPMRFTGDDDDEAAVDAKVDRVKATIDALVARGLEQRGDRLF